MTDTKQTAAESPRARAVARIREDHRALAHVMHALVKLTDDILAGHAEPDCALLAGMLYYIDSFPERYHHPKEDEHLFAALRRRTTEANAVLDELQGEHVRSGQLMAYLNQLLVHYEGGAPHGLAALREAIHAYANLLRDHMGKEETVVLPLAESRLTEDDWRAIDAAFGAHDDPLFGEQPRQEFRRLYQRIANLLPKKIRPLLREEG